jgi:resuscitation-promoting factor RpfB
VRFRTAQFFKSAPQSPLLKSKSLMTALAAVVVLAVAGTTVGYAALSKTVTVTLDGESRQVSAMGSTVGDVLAAEDIHVTDKDLVAPALESSIEDGSAISVQFGRPLELAVDGRTRTYWVNSTEVSRALGEIGRRFDGADLSVSRSASIGRSGMTLEVVTPKVLKIKIGATSLKKRKVAALTVADVLDATGTKVTRHDKVRPSLDTVVRSGDTIVLTDVRVAERRVPSETVDHPVVERKDPTLPKGEKEVVRPGRDGVRDVTYRLRWVNGKLVARKVIEAELARKPVPAIVKVGTKEEPAANYAGGDTVWDRLAQCESGGNWAINTGNGYYGGLQFSASTWRSVGGTGLPHQHSREEQIKRGKILQARAGWGQWPHCSSRLGLR